MGETLTRKPAYRSLFWPIVLIGAGVIWLLANFNIVSAANLAVLFRLWPLILIVVGLDLLIGRQSALIGGLIGVGTVVLIVVLMLVGPSIGLGAPDLDIVTETFSEPMGDTSSAQIDLNTSIGRVTVDALMDSNNLLDAEISHVGQIDFVTEGESQKVVTIEQQEENISFGVDWISSFLSDDNQLYWNIHINPTVPVDLTINSGVGEGVYNLRNLQLTGLDANMGVGAVTLDLPVMERSYDVAINGGSGTTNVTIPEGAILNLSINGGVGEVTIDVPNNAAVRINASSGVGGVNLPGNFVRVSGDDDNFVGEEGIWETEGYASADRQINIEYDGGVGSLNLR